MTMKKIILVLLCLMSALVVKSQHYDVVFDITDADGKPIFDGLLVAVYNPNGWWVAEAVTKNGKLSFSLEAGTYNYFMSIPMSEKLCEPRQFTVSGNTTIKTLYFPPVTINLKGADGNMLNNYSIEITGPRNNDKPVWIFSPEDESPVILYLADEIYSLRFNVPGYIPWFEEITVAGGMPQTVNIDLSARGYHPVTFNIEPLFEGGNLNIKTGDGITYLLSIPLTNTQKNYTIFLPKGDYKYNVNIWGITGDLPEFMGDFSVTETTLAPIELSYTNFATITITITDANITNGDIYFHNDKYNTYISFDDEQAVCMLPKGEYNYTFSAMEADYPEISGTINVTGDMPFNISYSNYRSVEFTGEFRYVEVYKKDMTDLYAYIYFSGQTFNMPDGVYTYHAYMLNSNTVRNKDFSVTDGINKVEVQNGDYQVTFIVTDHNGQPWDFVKLSYNGSNGNQPVQEFENGEKTYWMDKGDYFVDVECWNDEQEHFYYPTYKLTVTGNMTVELMYNNPDIQSVTFSVMDKNGNPVNETNIYIYNNEGENIEVLITASTGTVSRLYFNGDYSFLIYRNGEFPEIRGSFKVNSAQVDIDIDFSTGYYPATFNVSGGYTDFEVTIYDANNNIIASRDMFNIDDRYILLPNGSYSYCITRNNYANKTAQFTINNAAKDFEISYSEFYPVKFDITGYDGNTANLRINIYDGNGDLIVHTDNSFSGALYLPEGEYYYVADDRFGLLPERRDFFTKTNEEQTISIIYNAAPTYMVEFVCKMEDGAIPEAGNYYLYIFDQYGAYVGQTATGLPGKCFFELPNGKYNYQINNVMSSTKEGGAGEFTVAGNGLQLQVVIVRYGVATFVWQNHGAYEFGVALYDSNGNQVYSNGSTNDIIEVRWVKGVYKYVAWAAGKQQSGTVEITGDMKTINLTNVQTYRIDFVAKNENGATLSEQPLVEVKNEAGFSVALLSLPDNIQLSAGKFSYIARFDNVLTVTGNIIVDNILTVEIIKKTSTTVTVNVTAEGKTTVADAKLYDDNGVEIDKQMIWGSVQYQLIPGEYSLDVRIPEYPPVLRQITVGATAMDVDINFTQTKVTGVSLDQSSIGILLGSTHKLYATIAPIDAHNQGLEWSSSATNIATVSLTGTITAVSVGTATITVRTLDGGKEASCLVTVSASRIAVTGITLNNTTLKINPGSSQALKATIVPANATNQAITWNSDNSAIVDIDRFGNINAIMLGEALITAVTNDGGKEANCLIKVVNSYTVTFNSMGGSEQSSVKVYYGDLVTIPNMPVLQGFIFEGWFKEEDCINEWDFATETITDDLTLYAKWTEELTGYETIEKMPVSVYPNPTDGAFTLEFDTHGVYLITITDMSGKILFRQSVADKQIRIDICNYSSGVYMLIINDFKRQHVTKIIKK